MGTMAWTPLSAGFLGRCAWGKCAVLHVRVVISAVRTSVPAITCACIRACLLYVTVMSTTASVNSETDSLCDNAKIQFFH